jgi:hypothetical protein
VCKEAPHADLSVFEGMASREGRGREPHTMMRRRRVGVIGGAGRRLCAAVGGW